MGVWGRVDHPDTLSPYDKVAAHASLRFYPTPRGGRRRRCAGLARNDIGLSEKSVGAQRICGCLTQGERQGRVGGRDQRVLRVGP